MGKGNPGNLLTPQDQSPLNVLPPWMLALRQAAEEAINTTDVSEIVKKQVELAKGGDQRAAKFVFDQLLGGAALKGATFIQNNYAAPAGEHATSGSAQKLKLPRGGLDPTVVADPEKRW